ncbi:MAG TPA: LytTR family DNA-binding domain-containing protein [Bacteroidia bacterium]|jgi:two-component system LytT family response regulator|nr:LytTR family DNA-binding domain-containing protein [Bacteroidia bacterium]
MYKAVIIDDIEQARKSLQKDLAVYCPEITLIGEAGSVVEGVKLIKALQPEVVFLDVQMPDGSGFDLLDMLGDISFRIIFTTASDTHAIKAFRFSALDYLLKPIDTEELIAAVKKLSMQPVQTRQNLEVLRDTINGKSKKQEKLALHSQDKIHIVNISEIQRCESNVNYTEFHFTTGKKMLVTRTLKDFEELLRDHGFYRVHHSHLVNTRFIREFIKTDGGYLIMTDGVNIPVSSRKRPEVIRMLENL